MLRDAALAISQIDVSDPHVITEEQARMYLQNVQHAALKEIEAGALFVEDIYCDPKMLDAINRYAQRSVRIDFGGERMLTLSPAPEGYKLESIEQEVAMASTRVSEQPAGEKLTREKIREHFANLNSREP